MHQQPHLRFDSISSSAAAECLLDSPHQPLLGPEELPGQSYDAVRQCRLAFGPEYTVCPGMDVCSRLWCAVIRQGQMVCLTKKLPAVEGTPCGKGRICLQGKCVDKTRKRHYSVRWTDGFRRRKVTRETKWSKINRFLFIVQRDISAAEETLKEKKVPLVSPCGLASFEPPLISWPYFNGSKFNLVLITQRTESVLGRL